MKAEGLSQLVAEVKLESGGLMPMEIDEKPQEAGAQGKLWVVCWRREASLQAYSYRGVGSASKSSPGGAAVVAPFALHASRGGVKGASRHHHFRRALTCS